MSYSHAKHAGNLHDREKHGVLVEVLRDLRPRRVLDTHAGQGFYPEQEGRPGPYFGSPFILRRYADEVHLVEKDPDAFARLVHQRTDAYCYHGDGYAIARRCGPWDLIFIDPDWTHPAIDVEGVTRVLSEAHSKYVLVWCWANNAIDRSKLPVRLRSTWTLSGATMALYEGRP